MSVHHHQEKRHHYVIHSSTGTKHVVVKEHTQEVLHRHHTSPRKHYSTKEVEEKYPEAFRPTRSRSQSTNNSSATVESKTNFRPRRTVSEGTEYYKRNSGHNEIHHYHHHHHYHGGKEQLLKRQSYPKRNKENEEISSSKQGRPGSLSQSCDQCQTDDQPSFFSLKKPFALLAKKLSAKQLI